MTSFAGSMPCRPKITLLRWPPNGVKVLDSSRSTRPSRSCLPGVGSGDVRDDRPLDGRRKKSETRLMSAAAALLDRLGRPGAVRLGAPAPVPLARLSTGVPALDAALDGGLPYGRMTELVGARSAGRTGLACHIAASATRAGETIAWVDPEDALDPE